MKTLPKCPYHGTELVIVGEYLLACNDLVYKGKRKWTCQHRQYSPAELPFIKTDENKNLTT